MKLIGKLIRQLARAARRGRRVEGRISALVDEHFALPSRRDGRGRKSQELRAVVRALRHLVRATEWQHQPDLDPNVRREAQALVTTACHGHMPFNDLMKQAKVLRGRVNKAGKVRNARQPIKGCEPLQEELPRRFSVERLHTVERLARAGRGLGNCAKNNDHGLHDDLRQRDSDFYLVSRDAEPEAMFEVDLKSGEITQFLGKENADVDLPRRVLIALLRRLRLNGDHVEACLRRGAASIFVNGLKDMAKPDWRRRTLMVWCAPGQLVIKEGQRPGGWSRFEWDGKDWDASRASRRWRLDDLMTRHPKVARLAREAMKSRGKR